MNFCPRCGKPTERRVPDGDDRERHVCTACGAVNYVNPRMVVGCLVQHEGGILLCKRAIEPRKGYWTIPAGFLELGESAREGAARETWEEARARVCIVAPYVHFDVPHIGQAYLIYRAELAEPGFSAGPESEAVELVRPSDIPWSDMAFTAVRLSLELLLEDMRRGRYRHHQGSVVRRDGRFELEDHLELHVG
ncbi:MAG: NUDIX hydrolase [Myxococcales bacterium]|jgi:ADP-ribose/FAD diphosphatase